MESPRGPREDIILDHLRRRAAERPDVVAYTRPVRKGETGGESGDEHGRVSVTWSEYDDTIRRVGKALIALGVEGGARVGIMGRTRPEWSVSCLAAQSCRAIPVGIYQTCSAEQIAYIAGHAECRVMVVENGEILRKVESVRERLPKLRKVVLMDGADADHAEDHAEDAAWVLGFEELLALGGDEEDDELERRFAAIERDDLATFIYTSGTTGQPKAVMLTQSNLVETGHIGIDLHGITRRDSLISYLPLAHVAEQMLSIHMPGLVGITVHYAASPDKLLETLQATEPTIFFGVPRVWEKIHSALADKLERAPAPLRAFLRWARKTNLEWRQTVDAGQAPSWRLDLRRRLADPLLARIRRKLGFGNLQLAASGAAPISRDVLDFFAGLGACIYEVYGLSETSGPGTWNRRGHAKLGTVGPVIPGVEMRLGPSEVAEDGEGEVLFRGPNVFRGYYKDEAATAEAFDDDGFFRTGDLGRIDDDGFLSITGRSKEILITSGGKNIAPTPIEHRLKELELVGDAMILGDDRRFLAALLTLEEEAAARFAEKRGLDGTDLHRHPSILQALQEGVDRVNADLARVENIRAFRVLPERFSIEAGELTPTMKVKRRVVEERWSGIIDEIYR